MQRASAKSQRLVTCLIVMLTSSTACAQSDTGETADCVQTIAVDGYSYIGTDVEENELPLAEPVTPVRLLDCSEDGHDPTSGRDFSLWRIRGVDPHVALGSPPGKDYGAWVIWVSTSAGDTQIPKDLRTLLDQ